MAPSSALPGFLLEHHAGNLPLWLAPLQVVVATITSDADAYAMEVRDQLAQSGVRAGLDTRNEKISYKVREHSVQKVPVILALGQREVDERTVSMRRLGDKRQHSMSLAEAVEQLGAREPASLARQSHRDSHRTVG